MRDAQRHILPPRRRNDRPAQERRRRAAQGPRRRPPLSFVGGIPPSARGWIVPVDLRTSRTSTLPVESWMPKAPSSRRKRSALSTSPSAGSGHRVQPAPERATCGGARPEQASRPWTARRRTPQWEPRGGLRRVDRSPTSPRAPMTRTTATITSSASTSRPEVRPDSTPTDGRHQRAHALGEES